MGEEKPNDLQDVKINSLFLPFSHVLRLEQMDNFMGLKSRCEMAQCSFKIINALSLIPLVAVRLQFCIMVSITVELNSVVFSSSSNFGHFFS